MFSFRNYAIGALCFLASCGSTQTDQPLLLRALAGLSAADEGAAAAPDVDQMRAALTPAILARINVPVILAQVPSRNAVALLTKVGTNQGVDTFLSADGISISLRNGLIVATRGLGFDLMRADTEQPLAAITAPPQTILRAYDHLDGENHLISVIYECAYVKTSLRQTKETCSSPQQRFENVYQRNQAGKIMNSRQWVSHQIGWIIVEVIQ
jgi:hypothetical protein